MAKNLDSWSSIPFDITEQIICSCDNTTLLALAQTNHHLNHQAIRALLLRESSTSNHPKGFCFESEGSSHTVVPAFNLTFSVFHVPDFAYCFHPTPILFREALSVNRFLDFISIDKSITLSFDQTSGLNGFWRMDAASARVWRVIFIRLLKTVLGKGCCHLTLYGGLNFLIYYPREPPVMRFDSDAISFVFPHPQPHPHPLFVSHFCPALRSLYQGFIKWFKDPLQLNRVDVPRNGPSSSCGIQHPLPCPLRSSSLASTSDSHQPSEQAESPHNIETKRLPQTLATSPPSLTRLDLQSTMMLHPLFFQNTVGLIRENSGSLRYLAFDYIKTSPSTWRKLLKNISLPKLENFTLKLYGYWVGDKNLPGIILKFLARHPTVRELELEGIHPGARYPEFDSTNLLPNLESLEATPQTLSWLLQNPTAYPKLKRISHTYDYCYPDMKKGLYAIYDIGMVPLSQMIASTTCTRLVNVKFTFSTESRFFALLLIRPRFATRPPSQIFLSVENMTVLLHYNKKFVENFTELLPVLEMFPNLKQLEFYEVGNPEELRKINLIETVQGSCPLIREVKIRAENGEV